MRRLVVGTIATLAIFMYGCSGDDDLLSPVSASPSFGKTPASSVTVAKMPGLGGSSEAFSVNDAGDVVGYSTDGITRYPFAIRWRYQGSAWTLTKVGPPMSYANAINESGTIAGKIGDSAAAWLPGGPSNILGLGEAKAVNASNVVVGYQWSILPATAAAWTRQSGLWSMRILEPMAGDTASSYCSSFANAINDAGIVVGVAYDSNCSRQTAVAWIPKPNPSDGWERAVPLPGAAAMARSSAYGISGSTVVGEAWACVTLNGCSRRAYRWSLGNEPGITGFIGSLDARANSINVLGYSGGSYVDRRMHAVVWSSSGAVYQTLPEFNGYDAHWVWDLNNFTNTTTRLAVGGATDGRGGRFAVVWTVP
jgi:hypothetical protein